MTGTEFWIVAFAAWTSAAVGAWLGCKRLIELRRRLALEQAERSLLTRRVEETYALLEQRVQGLEKSSVDADSRHRSRRRAARWARAGGGASAPAGNVSGLDLPPCELELLRKLDAFRQAS